MPFPDWIDIACCAALVAADAIGVALYLAQPAWGF